MKSKRGKSKLFASIGIGLIILLITGVLMTAETGNVAQTAQNKTDGSISGDVQNYVENFVEKKGIDADKINNITQVDFNSLPKEVNIQNVNNNNLAIYQINYNKSSSSQDKVFVITYSVDKLKSQGDLIVSQDKREFLNFGFAGESNNSEFLKTSTGVDSSLEKGYVMMRSGSITGISTSLEFIQGAGNAEIIIYKNGEPIQFGNSFVVESDGVKTDYEVQSKGTVTFEPGDVISAYVKVSDGVLWEDANTLVEITTD